MYLAFSQQDILWNLKVVSSGSIVNTWIWEKSVGGTTNPYTATPKTTGFNKKIVFTPEGRVITYKNDVEIRNSPYQIEKGTGFLTIHNMT